MSGDAATSDVSGMEDFSRKMGFVMCANQHSRSVHKFIHVIVSLVNCKCDVCLD